jgi:hypothetical protein
MRNVPSLSRRSFLRGTGAAVVGLPLLELTHGKAWAQGRTPEKRFIVVFSHGGEIMCRGRGGGVPGGNDTTIRFEDWKPVSEQETLTPQMLGAQHRGIFDQHLSSMLLVRGVTNMACKKVAPYSGGHGFANVTALTAADVSNRNDSASTLAEAPSIDTVIAQRLGAPQPLRVRVAGHNYGAPFFQGPRQRAGASTDVRAVFNALFSDVMVGPPDPALVPHSSVDVPVILAGRAGGALRTGRHINYNTAGGGWNSRASTHNLFTSILHAFDQNDAHFGSGHADFEGPLPDLT